MQIFNKLIIHIDGASQGNPGPSGIGIIFETDDQKKLLQVSKFIGRQTNNRAEYQALLLALKILKAYKSKWGITEKSEVLIKTDSALLYNQVTGNYKVRDFTLQRLLIEIQKLKKDLPTINFELIPRNDNRVCDKLAKKAIKNAIKIKKAQPAKDAKKELRLFPNGND
ncbi:MAG: ribonuclease HI family protein [candidate division WOR-3 bacterium]